MRTYLKGKIQGKHCHIRKRDDQTAYKIFHAYPQDTISTASLEEMRWGDVPKDNGPVMSVSLVHATQIQNICWMHDLAPRVYGIATVHMGGKKYYAQIVEHANGSFDKNFYDTYRKVKELGEEYGFKNDKDDCSIQDVIDGRLVDFNTFHWKANYIDVIKKKYSDYARYGKKYYHPVPEWGLVGAPRKIDRIDEMHLDLIRFKNKSVLDLGCAGGMMCRYAKDRGAKSVIGIDAKGFGSSDPIKGAQLASFMLNYFDIEYADLDLTKYVPDYSADVVFYLSMNYHQIGIPAWLAEVTKEVCVFEDNSKNRDAKKTLEKMFKTVEYIGKTYDHDPKRGKDIYFCYT